MSNPADKQWQLSAITEALGDLVIEVNDILKVGRGQDNDIVFGSKQVSRNHAQLTVLNNKVYVKDLGSSNGTFINDERIDPNKSKLMNEGDTVSFAVFKFILEHYNIEQPAIVEDTKNLQNTDAVDSDTNSAPVIDEPYEDVSVKSEDVGTQEHSEPQTQIKPEKPQANPELPQTSQIIAPTQSALYLEKTLQKKPDTTQLNTQIPHPEQDKTTTTELQREADPEVLKAKQAATAQMSGTADLGADKDIGTKGNNAMQQAKHNPATHPSERKASGGWFIWLFVAIVIIGVLIWLLRSGTLTM